MVPFAVPRRFCKNVFCQGSFVLFDSRNVAKVEIFFENNLRFLRVSELKGFPNVHSEVGDGRKFSLRIPGSEREWRDRLLIQIIL